MSECANELLVDVARRSHFDNNHLHLSVSFFPFLFFLFFFFGKKTYEDYSELIHNPSCHREALVV